MRRRGGTTAPQRGQAMVLIALMIGALCAMLGLAIDSGRAFVDRREIQNSADAAAVAGAVTYIRQQSFANAELAIVDTYARNRSLTYGASPCTPASWPSPSSGGSVSLTCTFTNDSSQSLDITVTDFAPPSSFEEFTAIGHHSLLTAIIQAVGAGNTLSISATGCAATWDSSTCAAVPPVVLAESSLCGSGGDALTLRGASGSTPAVVGNVGSFGDVHPNGTPNVAGDTTYYCGTAPVVNTLCYYPPAGAPCTYTPTGVVHTGKPPTYNLPTASGSGTVSSASGLAVNLDGGVFDSTTVSKQGFGSSGTWYFGSSSGPYSNACYFLSGGVYDFKNITVLNGAGIVSNELRAPDEPDVSADPTKHMTIAAKQFWNMNSSTCAGSFTVAAVADATGFALPVADYAIRLTSVRYDTYNGKSYERESSPSACKTATVSLPTQGLSVSVSNVPGAQDYNVYISSKVLSLAANDGDPNAGKCNGYFYQLATIPVQNYVNETNADTSQCPSPVTNVHCTLGVSTETGSIDLCAVDRAEVFLGLLPSLPAGCTTLLNAIPDIQPQPAFSCTASAYIQVPPPKGTLHNPPISHSCGWPGPFASCTGGSASAPPPYCLEEYLTPADSNLPDQDEAVNYETANWGVCDDPSTQKQTLCSNQYGGYDPATLVTPGAVQLQADSGGCFNFTTSGQPFLFSGYQYSWALVTHSGPTTSGCSDSFEPQYGGEFVGHYYAPDLVAAVYGSTADIPAYGPQAPTFYGCFIASQPTVDGTNGLAVYFVTPTANIAITGYGIPLGSGC